MKRGILILSHGEPQYAKFAFNLGASIRTYNGEVPICLLHDGNWRRINPPFDSPFTHYREIKKGHQIPFYIKTLLNEYTPFQETLYLDADALCRGPVEPLFDKYQDYPFAVQKILETTGDPLRTKTLWADIEKVYPHYKIPKAHHYTETNTSFIYWKKGEQANQIFTLWEHFYAQEPFRDYNAQYFGTYPDELALGIALLHIDYRLPQCLEIFFRSSNKLSPKWGKDDKDFSFMGLYGDEAGTHQAVWKMYTRETQLGFLAHFGEYGFKMFPTDKWSAKTRNKRYMGIREGDRPEEIQAIIDKYRKERV